MARIIAMSDIHVSPTHGFFWNNWCIARDFARMLNPEAVIVNGDLCINCPDSDAEIAFAASALRELGGHIMALPGNHDIGDEPPGQNALPPTPLTRRTMPERRKRQRDRVANYEQNWQTDRLPNALRHLNY